MLKKMTVIVGIALLCAPYAFADDHEGGEMPPEGDMPQLMLAPPPETEKPDDVGEPPPEDGPEALVDWLTPIFHGMMDTDGSGELSLEELRAWAVHAHVPPMPPEGDMPPPEGEGDMPPLEDDMPLPQAADEPPPGDEPTGEGDEPPPGDEPTGEGDEPPPPGDEPPPPED